MTPSKPVRLVVPLVQGRNCDNRLKKIVLGLLILPRRVGWVVGAGTAGLPSAREEKATRYHALSWKHFLSFSHNCLRSSVIEETRSGEGRTRVN